MLIRISLIVAIVAGLAAAGLNFIKVSEQAKMVMGERDQNAADRDQERSLKEQALADLSATNQVLTRVQTDLASTKSDLDKASAEATAQRNRANSLGQELTRVRQDRDDAQATLAAWNAMGIPIEQMRATLARLKEVEMERDALDAEKQVLARHVRKLENKLALLIDSEFKVELPSGLKGKVLVVDPKWDFVVLNVGEKDGVLEDGELLVSREGRLVGKIRVRSVQKERCIANMVPGWKLSDIMEGDYVFY